MTEAVHISSLVVQAKPDRLDEAGTAIAAMAGAEIAARDHSGKLVVVLETGDETGVTRTVDEIAALDGVLTANLVYHRIDEEPGADAEAAAGPGDREA